MTRGRPVKATWQELRVQLAAHPLAYPVVRALSRVGPVARVPGFGVMINDADLARQVLTDPKTFRTGGDEEGLWTPVFGPSVLVNMDGPEHRTLRRKLAEFFTPTYVKQLCADVLDEPVARMAAKLRRGESVDVADGTRVMTGAVTSALVGLTVTGSVLEREAGYRRFTHQAALITGMAKLGRMGFTPRHLAKARAIADEVGAATSLAWTAGDENTAVGRMRHFGLSEVEARGLASAFLIAGTETVSSLVPRLVALLHDHGVLPAVAEAFRAGDTGPLDAAIDETSRLIAPAPFILRNAAMPGRIGHITVRTGERVVVSTANCGKAYGRFDLGRAHPPELRRLWFGAGPHFCLGYPLAMAETHAIVGALLAQGPLRITGRRAAPGVFFPAYQRLEVSRA
jgi:cytochrome P450